MALTTRFWFSLGAGFVALTACSSDDSGNGGGPGDGSGGETSTGGQAAGGRSSGGAGVGGAGGDAAGGADAGPGAGGASVDGGSGGSATGGAGGAAGGADAGACPDSGPCTCSLAPADTCPASMFCDPGTLECRPGCKGDAACASGSCGAAHDCNDCVSDDECAEGRVCGTGTCRAACTLTDDCPAGGYTCCSSHCVMAVRDIRNCGGCGVACTQGQYCGASGCGADTVANLCDAVSATFLLDEYPIDNDAAQVVRGAFVTACPGVTSVLQDQGQADGLNPTTGRPVAGADHLFVVLGGGYGQRLARYLEEGGVTRLYDTFDGSNNTFWDRSESGGTDRVVARGPYGDTCTGPSCLTETHDYFRFETVVEPTSGTRTLLAYGMGAPGTTVAGWFVANRVLTDLASFDRAYYVYEWRDTDGTAGPSSGDTFQVVESGD